MKNKKISKVRKEMFKKGLLDNSGENNPMYGKHLSEKNKKILRLSHFKEFKHTEETKERIRKAHKGKKLSENHKRKIGLKGILNPMYGKSHSKEAIKKIIEKRKNQNNCYTTSIEVKIQDFLKKLEVEFFTHQYMKIEHGYQCDILIPSMKMVIECDGDYWHKYPIGKEIDHIRTSELIGKGFKVLRLWEHEIKIMDINNFKEKLRGIN